MTRSKHSARGIPVPLGLAAMLVALTTGCTTAASSAPTTATRSTPTPTAAASPSQAPSATPAADVLTGTWATGNVTCEQKNAALDKAGFTAAQLDAAGWDPTCAGDPVPPFTLRFASGRLVIFLNGSDEWNGRYEVSDEDTFLAGDSETLYITYKFAISGTQLTIDMVANDFPGADAQVQLGEDVMQTAIYESVPFVRQP
jgi:hypothetical protein